MSDNVLRKKIVQKHDQKKDMTKIQRCDKIIEALEMKLETERTDHTAN